MKKKNSIPMLALAALAVFWAGYFFSQPQEKEGAYTQPLAITRADGKVLKFKVEAALTEAEQEKGLMNRAYMKPDHGMIFIFPKMRTTRFWMKDTVIPLDLLFIDDKGEIKTIRENAVPFSLDPLPSQVPVMSVLEINGGRVKDLGIAVGDKVRWKAQD